MAYPETLSDLQNYVLNILDEASNSTIGDLASGTGATATQSTALTLTQFLNEAAADFARQCYALHDTGTYTNLPANTLFIDFTNTSVTLGTYFRLWAVRTVSYNSVLLTHCAQSYIETAGINFTGNYPNDAAGTPLFWFETAMTGIGVYPVPSGSTHTLTITGLALPAQLSSPTDILPFQADQNKIIAFQAAARIAEKAIADPSIAQRIQLWMGDWEKYKEMNIQHMWAIDPPFAAIHFPRPTVLSAPSPSVFKPSTDLM